MFDILLQIDSTAVVTATSEVKVESVWSLLAKGGPIMIPLGILFAMVIYFFTERLLVIRKAASGEEDFMNMIRRHITNGDVAAAKSFSKGTESPIAKMIDKGLQRLGKPIDVIEKNMDKTEEDIVNKMITEQTIKRQNDIMVRLLESEKALKEQDQDDKRESKSTNQLNQPNPNILKKYLENKERESEMLRSVPPSLNDYYRKKVKEYFESGAK